MLTTAEITTEFNKLVLPDTDMPGITSSNIKEKFFAYKEAKRELEAQWGEWLRQKYVPTLNAAAANVILQKVLLVRYASYTDLEPFYAQEAEYINSILEAQSYAAVAAQVDATIDAAFADAAEAVEREKNAPAAVQTKRRENLHKWLTD